jgi:hypothetical protein
MTWDLIVILIVLPVFAVAFYAMLRMWINGLMHNDMWYMQKSYNSIFRRIFDACVLIGVTIVIVVNVLALFGYIKL